MKFERLLSFLLLCLLLGISTIQAQTNYPQDYFRSPINGRIYLSGTFGELRSNHFHSGIDIKTGGAEGKNVYAAADGWISRVNISPWGYGNAVYIEHPNGYTTVYGHLQRLKGPIAKYVKEQQYKEQSFAVNLDIEAQKFQVKKGDIIALSGNTGGSGGPHVHFEIRETASEEPLNPLLFGIEVKDFITPLIKSLRMFPAEEGALIQGKPKAENFILKGWGKDYQLKNGDSIHINGDFYLGISTNDKQNDSHNNNGVYQIELFVDSSLFYSHRVERLNFSTSRYINTLIDYDYYKNKKRRYQRSYKSPNNKLAIYGEMKNGGVLSLNDQEYHLLQYVVKDANGNTSILSFTVFSDTAIHVNSQKESTAFDPLKENNYQDENISVYFPALCLYDTMSFAIKIKPKSKKTLGPIFSIGERDIALQKNIEITLNNLDIPDSLRKYAFLGKLNKYYTGFIVSEWDNNNLSFKTKSFGSYAIVIDDTAPTIQLKTKIESIRKSKKIVLLVKDDKSGIDKYDAWLNGKWVLLQWDPKKNKMFYEIDIELQKTNILEIKVSDNIGNSFKRKINF